MPSSHLIHCLPLLLLPPIFPSLRVFCDESAVRIGQSCWSFSNSPPSEYSRLISLQLTGLISVLSMGFSRVFSSTTICPCCPWDSQESFPAPQFESISSLVLSLLYGPTLSSYMSTGKTIALTIWAFVSKVMFLLSNMLSRFVIAFLPRSKYILISWRQSPSTVILEPTKIKSVTASTFPPSICHEVMGPAALILVF